VTERPASPAGLKINGEIVVLIGWGRAILLQLAHPLIAAAISDNSGFHSSAGSYGRRARHTIRAMLDLTFGTPAEAQRIVDRINAIHDRINGRLRSATGIFPAGTPYSARETPLLIWVHATLIESLTQTYELLVGPLTAAEKDQYAADGAWLTRELGAPLDQIPTDYGAVEAFMRSMRARGEIAVGDDARRMAAAVLAPKLVIVSPVFAVARVITLGLLPDDLRRAYGFDWNDRDERRFRRAVALVRGARRVLPRFVSEWPAARRERIKRSGLSV
jgi:uncharacterized protein (DUF2236 family)